MCKTIRESSLALIALTVIFATTFVFHFTQSFYIDYAKGEKSFKQGRYMTSLSHFISVADAQPQNQQVLKYLAIVYDKLDRKDDTLKTLQALETVGIKDLELKKWLANTYYGNSDFALAEKEYKDILATEDKPEVKRKLAQVLAWQKKYGQAEDLLTKLCSDNPNDYKDLELLADIYAWNNNYGNAIELYNRIALSNSKNQDVILKLADALRYTGRDKEAVVLYKQYIEKAK